MSSLILSIKQRNLYSKLRGDLKSFLAELHQNIDEVLKGGGAKAVERNRVRKKLLARECIDRVLDPGSSFLELSQVFNGLFFECRNKHLWACSFALVLPIYSNL